MNVKTAGTLIGKLRRSFIGRAANILWISVRRYREGEYAQSAVALTYYTLFAIVPVAAMFFGIAKGFEMDVRLRQILSERLSDHKDILVLICRFADTTLKEARGGVVAGVGVAALFFAVMGLSSNIERAFNAVWELPPRRNLLRRFSNYIACMVIIPVLVVIVSSVGVLLRTATAQSAVAGFVLNTGMPLVLSSLIFFLIYLLTPNTRVRILPALVAGVAAGICFQLLQEIFVVMQRSIFRYNRIYGSFAALPLFMIWLRWSWGLALFGAELGFVMQNIGTGMFDCRDGGVRISPRCRRFRQLAVARRIYVNFYAGGGASKFDELVGSLSMPTVFIEQDLAGLTAAGVICRVEDSGLEEPSYVPLLPATLTVAECMQRLDACGDDELPASLGETETALSATEEKLRKAMLECPDDLPLVEVGKSGADAATA